MSEITDPSCEPLPLWYENDREMRQYAIEWRAKKLQETGEKAPTRYSRNRRKTDVNFKLRGTLRRRLRKVMSGNYHSRSVVEDLGCSIEQFKSYLEALFQPGMDWNNWGCGTAKWNIDHIMPLAAFDLTSRQHVLLACNYLNMRPLWFIDNMRKGAKIQ